MGDTGSDERGTGPAGPVPPESLAGRLERLFEVHRPPQEPERAWRNNEVVAACRAGGHELSESHLSELRRGIKRNPTMRTLDALAWFFDVQVGYFVDAEVARRVAAELDRRAASLAVRRAERRQAEQDERDAARELQRAIRVSGVTRTAHRGPPASARARADMMRALARALLDPADSDESADSDGPDSADGPRRSG